MSELAVSPNVAHSNNLQVLGASVEVGAEAIARCLGTDEVSNQLEGAELTVAEIQEALAARLSKKLCA